MPEADHPTTTTNDDCVPRSIKLRRDMERFSELQRRSEIVEAAYSSVDTFLSRAYGTRSTLDNGPWKKHELYPHLKSLDDERESLAEEMHAMWDDILVQPVFEVEDLLQQMIIAAWPHRDHLGCNLDYSEAVSLMFLRHAAAFLQRRGS